MVIVGVVFNTRFITEARSHYIYLPARVPLVKVTATRHHRREQSGGDTMARQRRHCSTPLRMAQQSAKITPIALRCCYIGTRVTILRY